MGLDFNTVWCAVRLIGTSFGTSKLKAEFSAQPQPQFEQHYSNSEGIGEYSELNVPSATTVRCLPNVVVAGEEMLCTASVSQTSGISAAPGGNVEISLAPSLGTQPANCPLVPSVGQTSTCTAKFVPLSAIDFSGNVIGRYPGQGQEIAGSAGAGPFKVVRRKSQTALSCKGDAHPGTAITCTAAVSDGTPDNEIAPTGKVAFATTGAGAFAKPAECTLVPSSPSGPSSCTIAYTPTQVGSHPLSASFSGDGAHSASTGKLSLTVDKAPPPPPPPPAPKPVPPNTVLTRKPKASTALRSASFAFRSDPAGASFECKLDKAAFRACKSPFKRTVKLGRHRIEVRAIDAAGNADPTPARFAWRVVGG